MFCLGFWGFFVLDPVANAVERKIELVNDVDILCEIEFLFA